MFMAVLKEASHSKTEQSAVKEHTGRARNMSASLSRFSGHGSVGFDGAELCTRG